MDADRVVRFFAVSSFTTSALAFVFMIATFEIARKRFNEAGFPAQLGPLVSTPFSYVQDWKSASDKIFLFYSPGSP